MRAACQDALEIWGQRMSKKRVREKNTEMLAIKQLLWAGVEMQSVLEAAQSCVFQLLKFQMCNNFCD